MIKHEFHYNTIYTILLLNLSNVNVVLITDKTEYQKYTNR